MLKCWNSIRAIKTQLSALVEKIEKLNKNDYLSATWKNLESVLTTAKRCFEQS